MKQIKSHDLPEITVYEGIESYKKYWLDSVKYLPIGSTDCIAGSTCELWFEKMGSQLNQYMCLKVKRKIKFKLLVFDTAELSIFDKYPESEDEVRIIRRNSLGEGNFNTFANNTLVLHSITELLIVEIKNKSLVDIFQNLFDILWESAENI